ncbi:SDR family oxidoreductase [Altererythrobacter sp. KTW20L]|uniref:SDR family NAD(P)-dependent oxidoreductase n=1 Tax=Altererythrobacter sp. KTW20L TaxID=2942210 RepID=UPI0020C125C8|nr:SDR family oxidoreductase [Altererythrobacter sp. KTW20L]MCL6250069.1 SDR family oxidoreductase [Altererythrobacter sp. KTW20L]
MAILAGQVALVTGAGRGFGRAIAEKLASEGASVALVSRSTGQLQEVAEAIGAAGGSAFPVVCDVTDPASIAGAVDQVEKLLGPVDLLVSNAGVPGPFGPLWEVDPAEWWRAQEVHIRAPFLLMHRLLPGMVARRRGRVICVSAKAARIVAPYLSAYCTGKIAQNRLVAEAAAELEGSGVAAFVIDPGFVPTQLARDTMRDPAAQKYLGGMVERLKERCDDPAASGDLDRCAQRCLDLASGRYDDLSGGYFELPDDLDQLLEDCRA